MFTSLERAERRERDQELKRPSITNLRRKTKIYSTAKLLVAHRPHVAPRNHSYAAPNVVAFVSNSYFMWLFARRQRCPDTQKQLLKEDVKTPAALMDRRQREL
jgi:hypothetical protein